MTRTIVRTIMVALRAMLVLTVAVGIVYTVSVTGVGQLVMSTRADGSLIVNSAGHVVGSARIGQTFTDGSGKPLPEFFQPRPSAAGAGYDGGASGGSNYGPENDKLLAAINDRRLQVADFNGVAPETVPMDALTASASGLDPDISPEYAHLQVQRVAAARGLSPQRVQAIVDAHTQRSAFGFLGEPTVNVVTLNLALAELEN